jgi:hypothetical protein
VDFLTNEETNKRLLEIVRRYGNGVLQEGKYLFEQIQRLPSGYAGKRMDVPDVFEMVDDPEVIVLLDPHPNNAKFAAEVASSVGAGDRRGLLVGKETAAYLLREFGICDMYITSSSGDLLVVGIHDDAGRVGGERIVWALIPNT